MGVSDDDIVEAAETFSLRLVSFPGQLVILGLSNATVIIAEDPSDRKLVH